MNKSRAKNKYIEYKKAREQHFKKKKKMYEKGVLWIIWNLVHSKTFYNQ